MKFEDIVSMIESKGRRKSDPLMIKVILLYYGAILMNRYNIGKDVKNLKPYINMYAMVFAQSGTGKGFITNLIEDMCFLDEYTLQAKKMYNFINDNTNQESDPEILRFLPSSVTVSTEGSKEGLYDIAKSVKSANIGSLNIYSEEYLDSVSSSNELQLKMKEAYDGVMKAKVKRGQIGDAKEEDIKGIVVNFLGAGSLGSISKETQKTLENLSVSGMFRRSYTLDSNQEVEKQENEEMSIEPFIEHFKKLDKKWRNRLITEMDSFNEKGEIKLTFAIEPEALDYIEIIDNELLSRAEKDRLNNLKQFDTGSLNVIVNAGYIIAHIEGYDTVKVEHLQGAWNIFMETRKTAMDTFKEVRPHNEIFDILHKKSNLTHSELMDLSQCDCIPKAKNQFNDTMQLVQELCYRDGKELVMGAGIVVRYSIRALPETNLDKLIMSWSTDNKRERAIAFEAMEFKWNSISTLATSYFREEVDDYGEVHTIGVDSFTTCHYEASAKTEPYGHRRAQDAVQGQNIIAFDIDDGMRLETAKELLKSFTCCFYTTKSHQTVKGNYGDRFRIIVPTKTKFHVTPEQHKIMYENASTILGLTSIDSSVKNVSRLFFTNANAEVTINEGELFDISGCLPDTNQNDKVMKILQSVKNASYSETKDVLQNRIDGYIMYQLSTINIGNLKNSIYNTWKFMIDMTGDTIQAEEKLWYLQRERGFPEKYILQFLSDR